MEETVIVAIEDVSDRGWLQAADVIVGCHRTRWAGRRWIAMIHERYPGCVVAVTRQRRGRWCLIGLHGCTFVVRGEPVDAALAVEVGRAAYRVWITRGAWR